MVTNLFDINDFGEGVRFSWVLLLLFL